MLQMASGYWVSQALYVAAKLGIADHLAAEPQSSDELARLTNTHPDTLYRLLRALASVNVFAEIENQPRHFQLTPLAECLRSDSPVSMRSFVLMLGEEHYAAWGELLYSVQTSNSAFEKRFGAQVFDYFAQHPESAKVFNAAMTSGSMLENQAIVAAYDFSGIQTIVDVGGGQGSLLAAILKTTPTLKGIVFDQPSLQPKAEALLEANEVGDRCQFIGGNFFESVPGGGDAYLMKHIIHDWDDERSLTILQLCRQVMPDNGRVLIAEQVISPGNDPSVSKFMDLNMLIMTSGGRERTEVEYEQLLSRAGLRLTRIVPTTSDISIVEGVKA
ncbi:MAG: methyltransferase [Elainellaceae cyanobacterium]